MRVYQVSREFYPYANAGGLKEVVTGLATALVRNGHDSSVFIPCYGFVEKNNFIELEEFYLDLQGHEIHIKTYFREYMGVKVYLLDYPSVASKNDVYTYDTKDEAVNAAHKHGIGFLDSDQINIVFQMAFLEYVTAYLEAPDIISLHDGHTGLIPGIIKSNSRYRDNFCSSKIFFTIHNAGSIYHQRTLASVVKNYNIIDDTICNSACFSDQIDPICLAVLNSNALTVSPYYATEILQFVHEKTSFNFGAFCKENDVNITGITNGVDVDHYESLGVTGIPTVDEKNRYQKELSAAIVHTKHLKVWGAASLEHRPLFIFQNRVTEQKGIDTLIKAIRVVVDNGSDSLFIVMGQGEKKYEKALIELADEFKNNVCYIQGYDEMLAKKLFISSDFFILTSLWEPCGLTDFEAQLAGSIPIVHKTGGLQKVIHMETGFVYSQFQELVETLIKCESLYKDDTGFLSSIKTKAYNNICENYTWDKVLLKRYIPLFKGQN